MEKRRNILIITLAVVLVLAAMTVAAVFLLRGGAGSDWQEQYDLGRRYLEEGNYEEAILAFSAAIEIDPKRAEAYLGRGEAYMEMGEYEKAKEDFEKAQRRASDNEDIEEQIEKLEERIEEKQQKEEQEQAAKSMKKLIRMKYTEDGYASADWSFSYNEAGLMTKAVCDWESDGRGPYRDIALFSYNENGQLAKLEQFDDEGQYFAALYIYDNNGLLIQEIHQEISGDAVLEYDWQLEYDGEGKLIRKFGGYGDEETLYAYNSAGQLISETMELYFDGNYMYTTEIRYVYDAAGRLAESTESNIGTGYTNSYTAYYSHEYPLLMLKKAYMEPGYDAVAVYPTDYPVDFGDSVRVMPDYSCEVEEGYLVRLYDDYCSYEFFYEDISELLEEEPQQTASHGSAEYEIQRVDESYYDADGVLRMEKFYDQVVLLGDNPAYMGINEDAGLWAARLVADMDAEYVESSLEYMSDDMYYVDTAAATVTHNGDGIFSFYLTTAWFGGGVFNANYYGRTYDLTTGGLLNLPERMGMSEEELVATLKDNAWVYLSTYCYDAMFEDAWDTLYSYQMTDFNYYIQDGQIILTFPTYELSFGAAGPLTAPTGLYIS